MFVNEGAMGVSVVRAHFREKGPVPVGRKFMKGCPVMLRHHCAAQRVIRSYLVEDIGVQKGVIVGLVLRLAELWSQSRAGVGA